MSATNDHSSPSQPLLTPSVSYEAIPPMTTGGSARPKDTQHLRVCRICLEGEDDTDDDLEAGQYTIRYANSKRVKNPLIHPCRCSGSMAYVHVECLNRWRKDAPLKEAYYKCGTCMYEYNLNRPWWASLFENGLLRHLLATLLWVALVLGSCYLVKAVDVYVLRHKPDPTNEEWYKFHGETFLWLDRFYVLVGTVIAGILGLVYLIWAYFTQRLDTAFEAMNCDCCPSWLNNRNSPCGNCHLGGGLCYCNCDGEIALVICGLAVLACGLFGVLVAMYAGVTNAVAKALNNIREQILEVPM